MRLDNGGPSASGRKPACRNRRQPHTAGAPRRPGPWRTSLWLCRRRRGGLWRPATRKELDALGVSFVVPHYLLLKDANFAGQQFPAFPPVSPTLSRGKPLNSRNKLAVGRL